VSSFQPSSHLPAVLYELIEQDGEPVFAWISDSVRELLELEPDEVLRDTHALTRMIHPDDRASHAEAPVVGGTWHWRGRQVLKSGRVVWVDAASRRASSGRVQGVIVDVTRQVELEQDAADTRKAAAVSLLAGSIAHELNDPLTFLRNNVLWALNSPGLAPEVAEALRDALEGSFRVEGIARTLGALPRARRAPARVPCTLAEVVDVAHRELRGDRDRVELRCVTPSAAMVADPERVGQALAHLVSNLLRRREPAPGAMLAVVSALTTAEATRIELAGEAQLHDADVGCAVARLLLDDAQLSVEERIVALTLPA